MLKTDIVKVIGVYRESGQTVYKVRLTHGATIYVIHSIIVPLRTAPLREGQQLYVTHELGRTKYAIRESSFFAQGTVTAVLPDQRNGIYQVSIQPGVLVELPREIIINHPTDRNILTGGLLEIEFRSGRIDAAKLISETDQVVISKINLEQRIVNVTGQAVGNLSIRIPPDQIRELSEIENLILEILYESNSNRKFQLRPIHEGKIPHKGTQSDNSSPVAHPKIEILQAPLVTPPPKRIEGEVYGVDLAVLENLKRSGKHRFEIMSFIEKHSRDGLIEWYELKSGQNASYQQPAHPLHPKIHQALQKAIPGFQNFFRHQALALDAIRSDRNLIIVTQTASGKTLSYNPAVFEYLLSNPNGCVIYIFPLNALMNDQLDKVTDLIKELERQQVNVRVVQMIGGMTEADRNNAPQINPNIVLTNPEMLNFILDRSDNQWRDFLSNLKLVVIDEIHTYRGLLGVHMTGIIRRLLLTARALGSDPRFVLSSATVHNPLDLATRLTSIPPSDFILIDAGKDGSQQADKHWVVLNPYWNAGKKTLYNYREIAAEVFLEMLLSQNAAGKPSPLHTILFCRSIHEVKEIKKLVDRKLERKAPKLKSKVKSYASAVLGKEEKREIYAGLKSGQLLGVISTNALEAGIDIGSLDVCIVAGFPFSVMALRQMAGRVGRKFEGMVCFIPYPLSSLDIFYYDHPKHLLTQPPEVFVVDYRNPYIARKHINAAAVSSGITDTDLQQYWGADAIKIVLQAQKDGVMTKRNGRWMGLKKPNNPYDISNLRSSVQIPYVVCKKDSDPCAPRTECFKNDRNKCKKRITLLDQLYVYRDCHPGAIYESLDGDLYQVISIDESKRAVTVIPLNDDCLERTRVIQELDIEIIGQAIERKQITPEIEMAWGNVLVTRSYTSYLQYTLQPARRCQRCKKEYDETIDICPLCSRRTVEFFNESPKSSKEFPHPYQQGFQILLHTVACWLMIQPRIENDLYAYSPCKLPGEQNKVLAWLKRPLQIENLPARYHVSEKEKIWISEYYYQARKQIDQLYISSKEILLHPGIYCQCLLATLRSYVTESRALELFEAVTGYPVTNDLRHICRDCRRSTLLPAMHTLEHVVTARYPSVALGDRSDIGALTTLGHHSTGLPTIFWYDNYEGGLGASEKIFELILRLAATGIESIQSCSCTSIEGCPRCTYVPDCSERNMFLSKPAGLGLFFQLENQTPLSIFPPFIYPKKRTDEFDGTYRTNEKYHQEHGLGEEAPAVESALDPYQVLRLQRSVHRTVVNKAFDVRSKEIQNETPPVNAEQLNAAYQSVASNDLLSDWQLRANSNAYEILEILPLATRNMVEQIHRAIAREVHPDKNPGRVYWANEMMKQINNARDAIIGEMKKRDE